MNAINCIFIGAIALIVAFVAIFGFDKNEKFDETQFLRIHIRANSNSDIDQAVKYEVKSAIVDYLTPYLVDATDKQRATEIISAHILGIEDSADKVLRSRGFEYTSNAQVKKENFPTRQYDDVVLAAGVYDALIVNLGTGEGNNWWCVVYPPLCFVGGEGGGDVQYRSKLLEIIDKFF